MGDAHHAEDLALARRCAAGEAQALDRLVERYGPFLAALARGVVGNRNPDPAVATEDLVGEVFLRVLDDRGALLRAYRGESSLKAYLAGIARRTAVDALRQAGSRSHLPLEAAFALSGQPAKAQDEALARALERLPERDRRALSLRYVEGLSYREIAERLKVPVGTAAAWVARARGRLKAFLPGKR